MANETSIEIGLRAHTLREIAKLEGRSYPSVLASKKRGEYVKVTLLQGRDLSGRKYETKLAKESGTAAEPVAWEGKDGRRVVERYLSREDSKAFAVIKGFSGNSNA